MRSVTTFGLSLVSIEVVAIASAAARATVFALAAVFFLEIRLSARCLLRLGSAGAVGELAAADTVAVSPVHGPAAAAARAYEVLLAALTLAGLGSVTAADAAVVSAVVGVWSARLAALASTATFFTACIREAVLRCYFIFSLIIKIPEVK
jgi:hypothetical protein